MKLFCIDIKLLNGLDITVDIDKDSFVFYIYHVFSVQFSELNFMKPELNTVFIYKCCYALYNIYVVPLI